LKARALTVVALLLAGECVVHDAVVPPARSISTHVVLSAIGQYRQHVSPRLHGIVQCRFKPTCSVYGYESVRRLGAVKGGWRAIRRIARCGPWTPMGTVDPP
jgi:uncharacterized protein